MTFLKAVLALVVIRMALGALGEAWAGYRNYRDKIAILRLAPHRRRKALRQLLKHGRIQSALPPRRRPRARLGDDEMRELLGTDFLNSASRVFDSNHNEKEHEDGNPHRRGTPRKRSGEDASGVRGADRRRQH